MSEGLACHYCGNVCRFQNLVLVVLVSGALLGCEETGSHLNSIRSKYECGSSLAGIADSTRTDDRDVKSINNLWQKSHSVEFTDVSA